MLHVPRSRFRKLVRYFGKMLRELAVRERLEEREEQLAPRAAKSRLTKGRARPEDPSHLRTEYQRDRDRIVHSKSFRRLKYKTQVFVAPMQDHYITRMTHTIQVSQIARTITRALNLNEDLVEAMSLAHDIGHTPFGHAGEGVLQKLLPGGFRHNVHGLRVVDVLEKDGRGLNLTAETREGILKHSKLRSDIAAEAWGTASTLEGQICKFSDSIAYINHDIEDAIRAGMMTEDDLPRRTIELLGSRHSQRIDTLVDDLVTNCWEIANNPDSMPETPGPDSTITLSPEILDTTNELREFLFENVYFATATRTETGKGQHIVEELFAHFVRHPEEIPAEFRDREESVEQATADFIAGMTDRFAMNLFDQTFKPKLWSVAK